MFSAILVVFVCVLIDLRLKLIVGVKVVSTRSVVVAVLNARMKNMSCSLVDFLVCAHSGKHTLICLVASLLFL